MFYWRLKINERRRWLRVLAVSAVCVAMIGCGKTVRWKQEVLLHDGRVIVVDRVSKQTGRIFPENVILEKEQELSFTHPDTGERIRWDIPTGLLPYILDFENKIPYYVLKAYTVADYNTWGCPNPPYLVFRYTGGQWSQVAIEKLPNKFEKLNLLNVIRGSEQFLENDSVVTLNEFAKFIRWIDPVRRVISRDRVNPIGKGCHIDTLISQDRKSEARIGYPTQGE